MTLRPAKIAVVLLLGFVLAWQGVFTLPGSAGATARSGKASCCRAPCNTRNCSTSACCAKPASPAAPVSPASLPSTSQGEFYALAASLVAPIVAPLGTADELPVRAQSYSSVTGIPLFQRD